MVAGSQGTYDRPVFGIFPGWLFTQCRQLSQCANAPGLRLAMCLQRLGRPAYRFGWLSGVPAILGICCPATNFVAGGYSPYGTAAFPAKTPPASTPSAAHPGSVDRFRLRSFISGTFWRHHRITGLPAPDWSGSSNRLAISQSNRRTGPGFGMGTCRSSRPGPAVGFTIAFM